MASVSCRTASICSTWLNWASWVTNWRLSVGLSGFWFLICATSSCRNVCSLASLDDGSADDLLDGFGVVALLVPVVTGKRLLAIECAPFRIRRDAIVDLLGPAGLLG